jgi:hypothetical protein
MKGAVVHAVGDGNLTFKVQYWINDATKTRSKSLSMEYG